MQTCAWLCRFKSVIPASFTLSWFASSVPSLRQYFTSGTALFTWHFWQIPELASVIGVVLSTKFVTAARAVNVLSAVAVVVAGTPYPSAAMLR